MMDVFFSVMKKQKYGKILFGALAPFSQISYF
jgi:hypothetical protein